MKKLFLIMMALLTLVCFSSCNFFNVKAPLSLEQVRKSAFSCFSEHHEEMCDIISQNMATGETDWCRDYNLLRDGQYEFVLYRWGFTGTNICAGILFLPDDMPKADYNQDANNSDVYTYTSGYTDKYHLERIEKNWFYFYYEYDF